MLGGCSRAGTLIIWRACEHHLAGVPQLRAVMLLIGGTKSMVQRGCPPASKPMHRTLTFPILPHPFWTRAPGVHAAPTHCHRSPNLLGVVYLGKFFWGSLGPHSTAGRKPMFSASPWEALLESQLQIHLSGPQNPRSSIFRPTALPCPCPCRGASGTRPSRLSEGGKLSVSPLIYRPG